MRDAGRQRGGVMRWAGVWLAAAVGGVLGAEPRAAWRMKEPHVRAYATVAGPEGEGWLTEPGAAHRVQPGRWVFVRTASAGGLERWASTGGLARARDIDGRTAVLEAASGTEALEVADAMVDDPEVEVASVSRRRFNARLAGGWAAAPDDPYFDRQWQLDPGHGTTGPGPVTSGMALRAAWAASRGASVVVGMYDDGADAAHPDLREGFVGGWARNWFTLATNTAHSTRSQFHGTATAGLAVARGGNGVGISGAAPGARWTGQVIFDASGNLPDTELLARALGHEAGGIGVQNHSWANADLDFLYATPVEHVALSNALHVARGGLGIPMVRSSGNTRWKSLFGTRGVGDANLDAFANHPGAITVAGLRRDGTVASYSTPGACVLVAAAGGEAAEGSQLFSLDPTGDAGLSTVANAGAELSGYVSGARMQAGTSFAAPQVTGLVALLLDLRPGLSVQDIQRLLAVASRPMDPRDPDRATNAAGLVVSHNVGHGTPDPALLVRLAALPRFAAPAVARAVARVARTPNAAIPDDGLRVETVGVTPALSWAASGGAGLHPDGGLGPMPWADGGNGSVVPAVPGACLLVRREALEPADLVRIAGAAGAAAVVVANSDPGNVRPLMLGTHDAVLPAVMVGRDDGEALRLALAAQPAARLRLRLQSAEVAFDVTEALSLDAVRVRLRAVHPRMGDLRVTLRSPRGTWSVLQRCGTMTSAQIDAWWYGSRRHAFEPSRGTWTLAVTDEAPGATGRVVEAELELGGLRIEDADDDGLDDRWELARLGTMGDGGADDPDGDGLTHAVEAWLGTDPLESDRPFVVEAWRDGPTGMRMSWPATPGRRYRLESSGAPGGAWTSLGTMEWPGGLGSWRARMDGGEGAVMWRVVAE